MSTGISTANVAHRNWTDCIDVGGPDLFAKAEAFQEVLANERAGGNHFFRRQILASGAGRAVVADPVTGEPREVIMMGSNSYLGLATHPRVVEASREAARRYGYGTGSVSLYAGTTDLHVLLEEKIARYYRCEDAILFPTGYAANVGVLSALLRPRDSVVNDLFNHASIYDGCALSGAKAFTYAHANARHLQRTLERAVGADHGTLVVTDGVFSMEGDVAPLDEIVAVARRAGARVMIDEAHALGVIGPNGRGTAELYGLEGQIDITVGTLSKVPAGIGGYATGSKAIIDYLRYYARPYFFSTSIPAPVIAGLIEVFDVLETDHGLRERLWANVRYMTGCLKALGFDTGCSTSAIVPVIGRDEASVRALLRDLWDEGIFANFVAYPAVPKRRARLRLGIQAQHAREDLDRVIEVLARRGRFHGLIS